jgi:hypothetical protein
MKFLMWHHVSLQHDKFTVVLINNLIVFNILILKHDFISVNEQQQDGNGIVFIYMYISIIYFQRIKLLFHFGR